jgi:WD40 repeat protein
VPAADARGDPDLLSSAGSDHRVPLWDPATRRPAGEPLAGHAGQVRAVAAVGRQDGATLLASGGTDGNVCLWHPDSGKLVRTIPIGVPNCDLVGDIGDPAALRRTDGGTMLMVGTARGIMAIDLNVKLFTPA